jgi:hypothetical protein
LLIPASGVAVSKHILRFLCHVLKEVVLGSDPMTYI